MFAGSSNIIHSGGHIVELKEKDLSNTSQQRRVAMLHILS